MDFQVKYGCRDLKIEPAQEISRSGNTVGCHDDGHMTATAPPLPDAAVGPDGLAGAVQDTH